MYLYQIKIVETANSKHAFLKKMVIEMFWFKKLQRYFHPSGLKLIILLSLHLVIHYFIKGNSLRESTIKLYIHYTTVKLICLYIYWFSKQLDVYSSKCELQLVIKPTSQLLRCLCNQLSVVSTKFVMIFFIL